MRKTNHSTGARLPWIGMTAICSFVIATIWSGCDDQSADGDPTEDVTISADQADQMCSTITSSATSTMSLKTAGATMDSCGAAGAQGGLNQVELTDFEGQMGGYLRLALPEGDPAPVFMLVREDVPVTVLEEGGEETTMLTPKYESQPCAEAGGSFLWIPDTSTCYLRFGPTATEKAHITLEIVSQ